MSETTYCQIRIELILNRAKRYYENNKEVLREKARNKYKKKIKKYIKKYQKTYREAKRSR